MKHRFTCLFATVMMSAALLAQNSISDINRIKRDKDYLYGEATLENKEAALKLANELLEVEIKNWAAKKDSKISSVLASKIFEYADTILLQRHNMVRAFVYVKTSNLKAIKGKNMTVKIEPDKPLTKPIVQAEEAPQPKAEPKAPVVKEEPKQPEVKKEAPVVKEEPKQPEVKEVPKQPEVKKEAPVVKEEPKQPKVKTPADEVIEKLKAVGSFHDLEAVIKPLKDEGKITEYGKYTTMKDPAGSYLIVYDQQGGIKALLGKGVKSRPNLKTGLDDSETNYHGCGAIWLKIKE